MPSARVSVIHEVLSNHQVVSTSHLDVEPALTDLAQCTCRRWSGFVATHDGHRAMMVDAELVAPAGMQAFDMLAEAATTAAEGFMRLATFLEQRAR